jgi:16S rRNA (adenine1518-N6/adenine1519-N6)-dimethyltransferase
VVENVKAKKALGQNFLTDPKIAQLMVENIDISEGEQLIEIGSGTGALTQSLASICTSKKAHFTAVEFDIDLIPILKSKIIENENVRIVNANILNFLDDFKMQENTRLKIIGSLPYNITSPLLHRLIKYDPMPESCVFLIQKEVAQKICAPAPDSCYLSVFVQTFYKTELLKIVDKNLFSPVPKVDGAVIRLTKKQNDYVTIDISRYEKFLHHAFSNPRKMLNKMFTKEELEKYGLEGTKRAQDYNSEEYFKSYTISIT